MSSMGWDPDGVHIRSLEKAAYLSALEGIAIQHALARHPISDFVTDAPVEDLHVWSHSHPANSDFNLQETNRRIEWSLPGRDHSSTGCGVRRVGDRLMVTACTADKSHYLKACKLHCWRLSCSYCFNDVCIRRGAQIEKRLLAFADLQARAGNRKPELKHWVISPPREWAVECILDPSKFVLFKQWIMAVMLEAGFLGGYCVLHPWRLSESHEWEVGPHVHIVGYGYVDNRAIVERYPGTIVKQVHPGERIRSVRHTIAYLLTHAGVGRVERDEDSIEWELDYLNHYIPGLRWGTDSQPNNDATGPLVIDWTEFAEHAYDEHYQADWPFAAVSRRNIRIFDTYKIRTVRRCECGAPLAVYMGLEDPVGEVAEYVRRSPIMVFAENFDLVMSTWIEFKSELASEGMDVLDFAMIVPQLTCAESMHLEPYDSGRPALRLSARRCIRYIDGDGGIYPMIMTTAQSEEFDRTGRIPAGCFDTIRGRFPDTLSYASESLSMEFRKIIFDESLEVLQ